MEKFILGRWNVRNEMAEEYVYSKKARSMKDSLSKIKKLDMELKFIQMVIFIWVSF